MASKFQVFVGDRVAFSADFLCNTGQIAGEAGHRRGTVVDDPALLGKLPAAAFAVVEWDNTPTGSPKRSVVNVSNLARVGPNTRFCRC